MHLVSYSMFTLFCIFLINFAKLEFHEIIRNILWAGDSTSSSLVFYLKKRHVLL